MAGALRSRPRARGRAPTAGTGRPGAAAGAGAQARAAGHRREGDRARRRRRERHRHCSRAQRRGWLRADRGLRRTRTRTGAGARSSRARRHEDVMSELAFEAMGSTIRIVAEAPLTSSAWIELEDARAWTERFSQRLSRFVPDSELCALNSDPREVVPASALLRAAIGAGLWAA